MCVRLSHTEAESEFQTCQLREKSLTEKHLSSKIGWGWRIVDKKPQKNDLSLGGRPRPTKGCRANYDVDEINI
jgi:hypothetical protein